MTRAGIKNKATKEQKIAYLYSTRTRWLINNEVDVPTSHVIANEMQELGLYRKDANVQPNVLLLMKQILYICREER